MHIQAFLEACTSKRVLVVGDLMLDRYLWGRVERISPEAPVPVVDVYKEENRLGGAANVGLNLHALGAAVAICGVVGNDHEGRELLRLAEEKGFENRFVHTSSERRTTVKIRILGATQQMLRVDKEDRFALSPDERAQILQSLIPRISEFDAIIFEDYDKSMLDAEIVGHIIHAAAHNNIPVMVDPKYRNFWAYSGCTLFKPNLKELAEGLGYQLSRFDLEGIYRRIVELRERMPHTYTLVTLSENGMMLVDENLYATHIPAHYRNITDVSGAGDTVISVMSLGLLAGLSPLDSGTLANLAGGLVCEEVGVVPINPEKLAAEAVRLSLDNTKQTIP